MMTAKKKQRSYRPIIEKLVGHEKNKDTVNVDTRTVGVKSKDAGKTLTLSL